MNKDYLNVALNIKDKNILFIGAGKVAYRKINKLIEYNCNISAISKEFNSEFDNLNINKINNSYQIEILNGFDIIFICTNDIELNKQIVMDCQKLNKLYNNSTSQKDMTFKMCASLNFDDFEISVSSNKGIQKNIALRDVIKEKLGNI